MDYLIEKAHVYGTDLASVPFPTHRDTDDTERSTETCFVGKGQIMTRKNVPDQHRYLNNRENNYL